MGSKKATVGYRYYLGVQAAILLGRADAVKKFIFGDREAWSGHVTDNATVFVNKTELFGGDGQEGGVRGYVDIEFGDANQEANEYVQAKAGVPIPAYRNLLTLTLHGPGDGDDGLSHALITDHSFYWSAMNPYIKPLAVQVQRIFGGWRDDPSGCWYPEKAAIPWPSEEGGGEYVFAATGATWEYQTAAKTTPPVESVSVPSSGWSNSGPEPFGHTAVVAGGEPPNYGWATHWDPTTNFWVRKTINVPEPLATLTIAGEIENGNMVFLDGAFVGGRNTTNIQGNNGPFSVSVSGVSAGEHVVAIYCMNELGSSYNSDYTGLNVTVTGVGAGPGYDMNPAHIIYECITDPEWGMGYPRSLIDDEAFTAAADTLYDEGFGLSLIWTQQEQIEEFVRRILAHINGVLYQDRITGLFVLKLIRDDYDPETLPVFDPSNIVSVEAYSAKGWGDTVNELTVLWTDPNTEKEAPAVVQNLANIALQGRVVSMSRTYEGIRSAALAYRVAQRDLRTLSSPLTSFRIAVNRHAWQVPPGGVFKMSWPAYNLVEGVFRVTAIDYGTLTDRTIKIDAVQDVFGLPSASYAEEQPPLWNDPTTDAGPLGAVRTTELNYFEMVQYATDTEIAALDGTEVFAVGLAERGTAANNSFGFYLAPTDDVDIAELATTGEITPTVTLNGAIDYLDTTIAYDGALDFGADGAAGFYGYIDDELIWVESVDADAGTMVVRRGIYDTVPAQHADDTKIWFWNGELGAIDEIGNYADGETIYSWFTGKSMAGEETATGSADATYVGAARWFRPYPPANVKINDEYYPGSLEGAATVTWSTRNRLQQTTPGEASAIGWTEGSITPEPGTTFNARLYNDDTNALIDSLLGTTGTTWSFSALSEFTNVRLEIEAARDGVASWQKYVHVFSYTGSLSRIMEDRGPRRTEGGAFRIIESEGSPPPVYAHSVTFTFSGTFSASDIFYVTMKVGDALAEELEVDGASLSSLDDLAVALSDLLLATFPGSATVIAGSTVTFKSNEEIIAINGGTNTARVQVAELQQEASPVVAGTPQIGYVDLFTPSGDSWIVSPDNASGFNNSGSASIRLQLNGRTYAAKKTIGIGAAGFGSDYITVLWTATTPGNFYLPDLTPLTDEINDHATLNGVYGITAFNGGTGGMVRSAVTMNMPDDYSFAPIDPAAQLSSHPSGYKPLFIELDPGVNDYPAGAAQLSTLSYYSPDPIDTGMKYVVILDGTPYTYTATSGDDYSDVATGLAGVVPGDFTVTYYADMEFIEIEHTSIDTPFTIDTYASYGGRLIIT